jgi:hypothetical protein
MKYVIMGLMAILSSATMAQGIPLPPAPPHPHPHPPTHSRCDDPCNSRYDGGYERAEGPLTIIVDRIHNSSHVNITLIYDGQFYYGDGTCEANNDSLDFGLDHGWPHSGHFVRDEYNQVIELRGMEFYRGHPYQHFSVTPNN